MSGKSGRERIESASPRIGRGEIRSRPQFFPRDLEPGLDPPKVDVANAAEIKKQTAAAANAGIDGKEQPLDDEAIGDLLEGTSPEGRAKGRLELKVDGSKARVVIRPRDYRVLEAKPGG